MMEARFAYVLKNAFKFPIEIKNDIVYCQRALKTHIKVHQMIVENFCPGEDNPEHKRRILDELESEIYEINAEQQYLFLRLRRIIGEFYKSLQKDNIPIDKNVTNQFISNELIPLVNQENFDHVPLKVRFRNHESALISKYFIVDSDDSVQNESDSTLNQISPKNHEKQRSSYEYQLMKSLQANRMQSVFTNSNENVNNLNGKYLGQCPSQVSLLKPISERVATSKSVRPVAVIDLDEIEDKPPASSSNCENKDMKITLPVSKSVKLSRLNLRDALNKAKTENLAAKAALIVSPKVEGTSNAQPIETVKPSTNKSCNEKKKSNNKPVVNVKIEDPNPTSSSEDSSEPRELSPPTTDSSPELLKTKPHDYKQADFLRFFNLFTPEQMLDFNIRRSKRKRRGARNNERADFHYGKFDITIHNQREKKKNDAKRKRTKSPVDRSSTSSPEENPNTCNECMGPGNEETHQCNQCKGFFHKTCHRKSTDISSASKEVSLCPACTRLGDKTKVIDTLLEAETKETTSTKPTAETPSKSLTLLSQYRQLGMQMAKEKERRYTLQYKSKLYKIQMQNLFNIVHTFKSVSENDENND